MLVPQSMPCTVVAADNAAMHKNRTTLCSQGFYNQWIKHKMNKQTNKHMA